MIALPCFKSLVPPPLRVVPAPFLYQLRRLFFLFLRSWSLRLFFFFLKVDPIETGCSRVSLENAVTEFIPPSPFRLNSNTSACSLFPPLSRSSFFRVPWWLIPQFVVQFPHPPIFFVLSLRFRFSLPQVARFAMSAPPAKGTSTPLSCLRRSDPWSQANPLFVFVSCYPVLLGPAPNFPLGMSFFFCKTPPPLALFLLVVPFSLVGFSFQTHLSIASFFLLFTSEA